MSPSKKKAAPKKAAKKTRRKTPKEPPNKAYSLSVRAEAAAHPYAGPGRKALFTSPDELQAEVDGYFKWILGDQRTRKVKRMVKVPGSRKATELEVDETYWARMPEPPTRTGLVLYLGFCSHTALIEYEKSTTEEFKTVVARARARVEQNYEYSLFNKDASRGAQFALTNMKWDNTTGVQHKDRNGDPTDPPAGGGILITNIFPNTTKPV